MKISPAKYPKSILLYHSISFLALFILLILSFSSASAQEPVLKGYIVLQNGDTIFGKLYMVERYANSQKIDFEKEGTDSIVRYYPHEIKAYGNVGGSRFESFFTVVNHSSYRAKQLTYKGMHTMKHDSIFLQLMVKGKMSLYYFIDGEDQNHFFIQKEGEQIEELINYRYLLKKREGKTHIYIVEPKYYLDQLSKLTADCKEVNNDFQSGKYKRLPWKREDMQDLVSRYNWFMDGQNEYRAVELLKERQSRFRWGVAGGYLATKLGFEAEIDAPEVLQEANFDVGKGLGFGAFVHVANEDRTKPWSFYGELFLFAYEASSHVEKVINPEYYYNYNIDLGFSYARLSEVVHYNFLNESDFKPYGLIGLSQSVFGLTTNKLTLVRYISGIETIFSEPFATQKELYPIEIGLQGGLGLNYKPFMLELRYEYGTGFFNISNVKTPRSTFQALIGFYLN